MKNNAAIMLALVSMMILTVGLGCGGSPMPSGTDDGEVTDADDTGGDGADDGGGGLGVPDVSDQCPDDPDKTSPGICGCGVADTDTDGDGTPDCNDGCPNDADKTESGICGCGTADTDTDGDGTPDCNDGCPNDADKTIPGACGCGQPEQPGCGGGGTGGGGTDDGETVTLNLAGAEAMVLVRIPAGTFDMGTNSEDHTLFERSRPVHSVTISQPFYVGTYQVAQAQWQNVMGTTPWLGQSYVLEQGDSPATYVSWDDCQSFCQAVRTQTGYAVRLPTEAEWEYACRAGSTTEYYFGDEAFPELDLYAWYDSNTWDAGELYAHPVGLKLPNDFGLHDMHGNVYDWCEDEWHYDYTGAPSDGSAWVDGSFPTRIIRGGSWSEEDYLCRSATRYGSQPETRGDSIGFRLALDSN